MSTNLTANIVSWAPNPDGRGTIELLWTCFATIFLCTWSAIHPNLPGLGEKERRIYYRRLGYVLFCIIAPEYVASVAIQELSGAMKVKEQRPNWTIRQCFFFCMGGFVIQSKNDSFERCQPRPDKLLSFLEKGTIPWPDPLDAEIQGRSRADWLTKGITMVQLLYFVTSLIGRWAQGLAVTSLELFTLGIVFCAIATFLAWWNKPFDVQIPIVLFSDTRIKEDDCTNRLSLQSGASGLENIVWVNITGSVICLAFAALHIAAWNFYFPSSTEQLLWRFSSVMCTVLVTAHVAFVVLLDTRKWHERALGIIMSLYILVRTYMFVEMFVSLRAAPESVYQTVDWSQYFPSLG